MITFKINDKPVIIPTKWEEVTYSQWISIGQVKDDTIEFLSIFTDTPVTELRKMVIIGADQLLNAVSFLHKAPLMPGYVTKCGPYPIPNDGKFNIQFESLGQFEDMRAKFRPNPTPQEITKDYGKFVAIYLQKIRDKEYDPQKVASMEEEIQSFPAIEVITLGSFFFLKLMSYLSGTPQTCPTMSPSPKKSKPGSRTSKRSSASMRKSTGSRGR